MRGTLWSLSDGGQADVVHAFGATSRYLDNVLDIGGVYFDSMVSRVCPSMLQLSGANASGAEATFLDLHLSVSNDIVSVKV